MAPLVGILLHAIGRLAAGANYVPFHKISDWSWQISREHVSIEDFNTPNLSPRN